jgi:hypothetical protein
MKKTLIPSREIMLNSKNESIQNLIISMFKVMGIPVYKGTTNYDSSYPYLMWDGNELTQSRECTSYGDRIMVNSMEEFMSHFIPGTNTHIVEISDRYDAVITKESVKVGCQTVSFELVKEIYEKMKSLQ